MSTNANPAPAEIVSASPKLAKAIASVIESEGKLVAALDNYRVVAKSEATRLGLSDGKALTAILFASGDKDARRVSEVSQFVFPKNAAARAELDKIMEFNAKQTDNKKRIPKPVILAIQRDKEGKLTIEAAQAALAKEKVRQPGGQTNQTETKTSTGTSTGTESGKPLSKKEQAKKDEETLSNLIAAALNFAKKTGYDMADFNAIVETVNEEVGLESPDEPEETEDEKDAE